MTSHQQLSLSPPGIIQCTSLASTDQDQLTLNTPDLPVDIVITVTIMGRVGIQSSPLTTWKNDYHLITQSADSNTLTDYWDNQTYPRYQGGLQSIYCFYMYYIVLFMYFITRNNSTSEAKTTKCSKLEDCL